MSAQFVQPLGGNKIMRFCAPGTMMRGWPK
jgi:hypothetical protein